MDLKPCFGHPFLEPIPPSPEQVDPCPGPHLEIFKPSRLVKIHLRRQSSLVDAFEKDGYIVRDRETYKERRGILAHSKTARNYDTGEPKTVLYVEGNAFERGYLIGLLAADKVERMVTDYVDNIIPSMLNAQFKPWRLRKLKRLLMNLMKARCVATYDRDLTRGDLPEYFRNEMHGIAMAGSSNNSISGNTCTNNHYGINVTGSSDSDISGNTCSSSKYGIYVYRASNNIF